MFCQPLSGCPKEKEKKNLFMPVSYWNSSLPPLTKGRHLNTLGNIMFPPESATKRAIRRWGRSHLDARVLNIV